MSDRYEELARQILTALGLAPDEPIRHLNTIQYDRRMDYLVPKLRRVVEAEVKELENQLREDRQFCLCGCPADEHEDYGEDGQSCGNPDHECLLVAPAVRSCFDELRAKLASVVGALGRLTAATDAVRGDLGTQFPALAEAWTLALAELSRARAEAGGGE